TRVRSSAASDWYKRQVHFDMYRIADEDELETTGYYDYLPEESIFAIEWSENIEGALPVHTLRLTLERLGDEQRRITLEGDERFADIGT
ncbi:MAG: tRNA (adenosine(37)-N6)-threonylcarbamoyltransferase complex ATPase subunit type 1 TsaE, partial [Oscillospiraceae bacterium]|nr:tRNA (adenosine(37)-N6)-threonylcarbamoyltransferase complex ATPase subunit type 1 TsaE [Oscillospiraceae bacterium]